MVPTSNTSLDVLWAEYDLAETKHFTASVLVYGFTGLFALTALANLATFVWVSQHRLLVAATLLCALVALSLWTIGIRHVDVLALSVARCQRRVDEHLNLPVS